MSSGHNQCSRCLRRFQKKKSAEAHIRQVHGGKGEVRQWAYHHGSDDEPSMADRAVQAEIDRACGIPFTVSKIGRIGPTVCRCGTPLADDAPVYGHHTGRPVALGRLKRFEPPSELKETRTNEPIKEVA